jgi:DNA processing protein
MHDADRRTLLIALNAAPRVARAAIYRLAEDLGWCSSRAPDRALAAELGLPVAALRAARAWVARAPEAARREEEAARASGGRLVVRGDAEYPESLAELPLPPPVLAVRGDLQATPAVAIVGSRRADSYGREAAEMFATALAASGVQVVSGFARGVDQAAHRAALRAPGGRTVAVLGCALGVDYPRGQAGLAGEIAASGAVVSEFPSWAQPRNWHFPLRNRTLAALAEATLVVRAALRSGSLVTARHALDLGRSVWAVPGSIFDELSLGTNALLRDGAAPALHPHDLLDEVLPGALLRGGQPPRVPLACATATALATQLPPGLAGEVYAALPAGVAMLPEEIAQRAGMPLDRVLSVLLELEIDGLARKLPGGGYAR